MMNVAEPITAGLSWSGMESCKRSVGRPLAKWWDDLRKRAGGDCMLKVAARALWCALGYPKA